MGATEGKTLGFLVGTEVVGAEDTGANENVGTAVGASEGGTVGATLGAAVGRVSVGADVDAAFGFLVGAEVVGAEVTGANVGTDTNGAAVGARRGVADMAVMKSQLGWYTSADGFANL